MTISNLQLQAVYDIDANEGWYSINQSNQNRLARDSGPQDVLQEYPL